MFVNEFTTRFKSAQTSSSNIQLDMAHLVTVDDNDILLQPVHELEFKDAIFQMVKFKIPGPDGFRAVFFEDHWNIVKEDICTTIKSFFKEGKLLRQINNALIALIPMSLLHQRPVNFDLLIFAIPFTRSFQKS